MRLHVEELEQRLCPSNPWDGVVFEPALASLAQQMYAIMLEVQAYVPKTPQLAEMEVRTVVAQVQQVIVQDAVFMVALGIMSPAQAQEMLAPALILATKL